MPDPGSGRTLLIGDRAKIILMDLFSRCFGRKNKPVLVFLPGWGQDNRSFFPLVGNLKDYRLCLVDLPGFGRSRPLDGDLTSNHYAQTIIAWLKKKKITKSTLVGHSFGGKVAAIVAAQEPSLFSSLVLIAPAGIKKNYWWYPLLKKLPDPLKQFFSFLWPFIASDDYRRAGENRQLFKSVVGEDLTAIFKKITLPTLIIWGTKDDQLPVSWARVIGNLIENSRVCLLEGAGHFPFWDQPQKVTELIKKFVDEKA